MENNLGFSVLGDSISTLKGWVPDDWRIHYEGEVHVDGVTQPTDTWWGRVIDHYSGRLISNSSYSGSVMEGFGFPGANCDERIERLRGSQGEVPDVVLVMMGINDYGWGGGRNQVMGESVSASAKPDDLPGPKEVAGVIGPEAVERFQAAYEEALSKITSQFSGVEIWCVTLCPGTVPGCPWPNFIYRIRGQELDSYNDAIKAAAASHGAHVADVRAFGVDYDSVDGVHPAARGMAQLADMVISQMEGQVPDPCALPSLADAPTSQRGCYEDNCDGCQYADIEKHRWSLYCSKYDPEQSHSSVQENA